MKTKDKPSDLINQAITNLSGKKESLEVIQILWSCMKLAAIIELKDELKIKSDNYPDSTSVKLF